MICLIFIIFIIIMDTIFLSKVCVPDTFCKLFKLMIITGIVGILHIVFLYLFCITCGMTLINLRNLIIILINHYI